MCVCACLTFITLDKREKEEIQYPSFDGEKESAILIDCDNYSDLVASKFHLIVMSIDITV